MALQFVLGPSGAGKSQFVYTQMIEKTMKDPQSKYILLVPEQNSLALQRKLVTMHPRKGSFQIDVIGFNRLAYRVFDELHIRPGKVLEDFGKSMLIRKAAGEHKGELQIYGNSLDKAGFIDEAKSLLSEMYQYDVSAQGMQQVLASLSDSQSDRVLVKKLQDMHVILQAFEEKKADAFLVAEQLLDLLTAAISKSRQIAESEIVLDGFTGFTPIQWKVIRELIHCAKKVTVILTIDKASYEQKKVPEHALFALTKQTMDQLLLAAQQAQKLVEPTIFLERVRRWESAHPLAHLERNLFRYPYQTFMEEQDAIGIYSFQNPRQEMDAVASMIRYLVMKEGYRYRDIAVVSGNLEESAEYVERIFPQYDIPCFVDMTMPVKHHPGIDALTHLMHIVQENFSFDSVFALLKSGVIRDLEQSEVEILENYCLSRGRKGYRSWCQEFRLEGHEEIEDLRKQVMEILSPIYKVFSGKKKPIKQYVEAILTWMDTMEYESLFENTPQIYEKLRGIFEKMVQIMPQDLVDVKEFEELFQVGLKDVSVGMIPPTLDMVVIGDITRSRLPEIRALFIVGVNDGVIPKRTKRAQIINDKEKERLETLGFYLAPTQTVNSYREQFYLYINMTKPTERLFLSYVNLNGNSENMRPSYILERIQRLYPNMRVRSGEELHHLAPTLVTGVQTLICGLRALKEGDTTKETQTKMLYRLYMELGQEDVLGRIEEALAYHNIPKNLEPEVIKLLRLPDMILSVSKLEQYAKCAYSFYLRYILGLRERQLYGLDNRDIGIILHRVLEQIYTFVRDECENDWSKVSDEFREELAKQFIKEGIAHEYEVDESEQGMYQVFEQTLLRIVLRTLKRLDKLTDERYTPFYFEHKFDKTIRGQSGASIRLTGVIDRGDICIDEENETVYFRVIDYKSGAHDFELGKVYEGIELQIAIYTDVLRELIEADQNRGKHPEDEGYKNAIAEGMYYYQLQDPYVVAQSEEEAEQTREKKLQLKGVSAEQKEKMDVVLAYAGWKAGALADEIGQGRIEKYPETDGQTSACDYCSFRDVCRFDTKYGKNRFHNTKHLVKEEAYLLEEMSKKCHGQPNNNK